MGADAGERRSGKAALVETVEAFGDEALRDVWLFDETGHEAMFVRDDVAAKIGEIDVDRFVDNERYGYVTRDTYDDLYYADYEYTVRGFDGFEKFRTFLSDADRKIGVFASFDRREGGYDFGALYEELTAVVDDHPVDSFAPE
ncbi:hypothetical protein NGM10_02160 [Halorussus salilacus]|uniref:DUF7522 family protein n=1 Tax=Halorussus salilacus TaxID=2953750 RepID=UPI00209FA91B|nr:hypothetical protein [Halorussus salilacus]USZ68555.1 hypothetical protein NGM10_02160 [Halorussus salilacus]